ncbi:MAG: hypothetical protein IJE07_14605 [Clostridia bacterium]|nr:hypothetical protein [Clostridia bacterium]
MRRVRDFFSRHPRFATGLHVFLSVAPLALLLLTVIVMTAVCCSGADFYAAIPYVFLCILAVFTILCVSGLFLLLALLLYRFTHTAQETWPDRLRMALIRLNIVNGFMAFGSLLFWIWYLTTK